MIRKATAADIDSVEQSYLQLLDHEALHGGHTNWVRDVYPTRATAEGALSEGTLFVLEEDGAVRGSMILNQTQLPEYAGIDWAYPAQQVLVIHTLCIPPAQAGGDTAGPWSALPWRKRPGRAARPCGWTLMPAMSPPPGCTAGWASGAPAGRSATSRDSLRSL